MTNIKRLFICILLVVFFSSALAYNDHRNARVDSLEAALRSKNPPKGEELLKAYEELTRGWLNYDGRKSEEYGRKALALSYGLDNLLIRQNILRHLGLLRYGSEKYDEALSYFQQALAVTDTMATQKRYTQKDLDDARSSLYGTIGNLYNMQDKGHLAIHYYQQALPIFERNGWQESQSVLYHNIGELYLTMGNIAEAERNYLLAIRSGESSGDSLMMAMARKGLLKIYIERNDYKRALLTAKECYGYYHAHRDVEAVDYPTVLASLVRLNLMAGHQDIAAAKAYAREALAQVDSLVFENRSDVYAACCELAMTEHQWQQALGYALHAVHPDSSATQSDAGCYRLLAEIYTELGDKAKAREYIQKMHAMMTRYATDHYQSGLSQMEVIYETEKKETQISALAQERSLYFWLLAAAIGLTVLLALLLVYRHLAHRRQKALLAARVALQTEARERHLLARDLHDSLGGMLSLLRMKSPAPSPEGERSDFLKLLDDTIVELRRVSHHLMPEELLSRGLPSALHDFAVSVPGAQFQAIGDIRLSKEYELTLYRCAYELVNNALKHANASHIDLQLIQDAHEVTLTVSDDGKGMAAAGVGSDALNAPRSGGVGLQNIRERIAPYRGTLRIVTDETAGTEINVSLPL